MNRAKDYLRTHFPALYKKAYRFKNRLSLSNRSADDIFADYFQRNSWGDNESISGPGSRIERTIQIRAALPQIVRQYECHSLLDIPCGDFNWMKLIDWDIDYTGADIVADLVDRNQAQYGCANRRFLKLDLLQDKLPRVDLVLCRDCLVHFSYADIFRAFANLKASQSTYLLTTTNTTRPKNHNIATGEWRPLNLQQKPFSLPEPICLLDDTFPIPHYQDKHLGLWRIADLPVR